SVVDGSGASVPNSVSRTSTGVAPGSARTTEAPQPSPPPCGHSQTLETAVPGAAAPGTAGPIRSAAVAPTTTTHARLNTTITRPNDLNARPPSSRDRSPRDPERDRPHDRQEPCGHRARELGAVPDLGGARLHREGGGPSEGRGRIPATRHRPGAVELGGDHGEVP